MLLLAGAITGLFLGVALVALTEALKPEIP